MNRALVIQHLAFEDLGSLAPVLEGRGFDIEYRQAGVDELEPCEANDYDLWVILGGPIGVNDRHDYPFLNVEIDLIRMRLQQQRPTLGICLGAQLMAVALGAEVYASGLKEIGWFPIQLTAAGHNSVLAALAEHEAVVLHWHGDTFDIPAGTEHWASSSQLPNQAFAKGSYALALQFHPEVTQRDFERWLIGHTLEIQQAEGGSVGELRAAAARYAPALEQRAVRLWNDWLDQADL